MQSPVATYICPCCNLKRYIDIRKKQFNNISLHAPVYVNFHGQALTRNMFLAFLKQLLQVSGLPCDKYSGHSFRIGAATSAAAARIEDHLIKTLGRWSSDSYCRLILTPKSTLQAAQMSLITSISRNVLPFVQNT